MSPLNAVWKVCPPRLRPSSSLDRDSQYHPGSAPSLLGADTEAVLAAAGLGHEEIASLRAAGII